jgi:hypothetical protein
MDGGKNWEEKIEQHELHRNPQHKYSIMFLSARKKLK